MKKLLTAFILLIFYCCIINTSYATLPTPNLQIPVCGATNVPIPVYFQWSSSSGATWYDFQILINGITIYDDSNHITLTHVTISDSLHANTQYSWRVKAHNTTDSSNWSAGPCYFTTSAVLPSPPLLSLPADSAINVSLTPLFVWYHSTNALTFHLEVALDPGFGNPYPNIPSITDTFYQITSANQLAPGTRYYWRVAGANSGGEGAWSSVWTFSTQPPLPVAPLLQYPPNGQGSISVTPTIIWHIASGATSYHFRLWPVNAPDTTQYNSLFDIITDSTQYTIPASNPLSGLTTYYWAVWGINLSGSGPASLLWNFTTITAPPVPPTLVSPPDSSTCISRGPLLIWNCVASATSYRVQVSTDPNFGLTNINTTVSSSVCSGGLGSYQVPNNFLNTNTKYYWRVNGSNSGGPGNYSSPWYFTTIPPNPLACTLLTPPNGATNVPLVVTFTWSQGTNATFYHLQIATNTNFTNGSIVIDQNNITTTSYTVSSGLIGCVTYYWRVYSCNCALPAGVVSSVFHFTTITTITLNLKVLLEGFYNGSTMVQDTVKVFLANQNSPHAFVDTNRAYLSALGTDSVSFSHAPTGSYYIVIRHRNHLETWSSSAKSFVTCSPTAYDFTSASSQAYGNNMKQVGSVWVLYAGDINQDGTIDAADYNYFITEFGRDGYRASDLNGDNWIDGYDLPFLYSNFGHSVISPP